MEISDKENIYGIKNYDPSCPFVVLLVKDDGNRAALYKIIDYNHIDDVGVWSVQARTSGIKADEVIFEVGLSCAAPAERDKDLSEAPTLKSPRLFKARIIRQIPSLRPD